MAEAEALCLGILKAQPQSPEAEHILGVIAHRNGKLGEAIEHIRRAIAINPNVVHYHSNLGEMYRLAGSMDESIAAGRRALEIDADNPSALNNFGIALFEQDKFAEALNYYDQAIGLPGRFCIRAQQQRQRPAATQAFLRS